MHVTEACGLVRAERRPTISFVKLSPLARSLVTGPTGSLSPFMTSISKFLVTPLLLDRRSPQPVSIGHSIFLFNIIIFMRLAVLGKMPQTPTEITKVGHPLIFEINPICFPLLLFIRVPPLPHIKQDSKSHVSTLSHHYYPSQERPQSCYLVVWHLQNLCHSKAGHKLSARREHRTNKCGRIVRLLAPPSESIPAYRNSMAHSGPFVSHVNERT